MKTPKMQEKALGWVVGILFIGAILSLYVVYHRKNWAWLRDAVNVLRSWWIFLRLSIGC